MPMEHSRSKNRTIIAAVSAVLAKVLSVLELAVHSLDLTAPHEGGAVIASTHEDPALCRTASCWSSLS